MNKEQFNLPKRHVAVVSLSEDEIRLLIHCIDKTGAYLPSSLYDSLLDTKEMFQAALWSIEKEKKRWV